MSGPRSSTAAPVSSLTDAAERGIARARFNTSIGRRYLAGPRLPRRQSLDEAAQSPELIYALFVSAKTFARVLDTYGQIPTGTLAVVAANVAVFSLPNGVAFGDVCLNPYAVLHLNQLERLDVRVRARGHLPPAVQHDRRAGGRQLPGSQGRHRRVHRQARHAAGAIAVYVGGHVVVSLFLFRVSFNSRMGNCTDGVFCCSTLTGASEGSTVRRRLDRWTRGLTTRWTACLNTRTAVRPRGTTSCQRHRAPCDCYLFTTAESWASRVSTLP